MTIALLYLLGTCFVRIQSVRVKIACTKRVFNLSTDVIIRVLNASPCTKCAMFPSKNTFNFGKVSSRDLQFWSALKVNSSHRWKRFLSWKALSATEVCISPYKKKNDENFYESPKCKACCDVLNIPFGEQKPKLILFGTDDTYCFVKKTSRDYENGSKSPCSKNFLRQSQ